MRKEDPVTWPDTVSGQFKKYLVMQGPAQIKKDTFPRNSHDRCFSKQYCERLLPNGDNVKRPGIIYSESELIIFTANYTHKNQHPA